MGRSRGRPAAMKVERRIRKEEGEYDAPVTPDRRVLRQNVVGRTVEGVGHKILIMDQGYIHRGGGGLTNSPPRCPRSKRKEEPSYELGRSSWRSKDKVAGGAEAGRLGGLSRV